MEYVKKPPIFIFSAGWRSGSTMLQRMITATNEILVWGEAGGALDNFAGAYERYEQMIGPGEKHYKYGYGGNGAKQYEQLCENKNEVAHKWIACLNPPINTILDSIRESICSIYEKPALALGYDSWGVKEVQSGIDTANFLKKLFPNAKFVFLIRNPINCILSIKRRGWMDKSDPKDALVYYANNWLTLARSFRESDFGMLVKYENLVGNEGDIVKSLANYLEIPTLEATFIGNSRADWKAENNNILSFFERRKLLGIVGDEMREFGYQE